ncbi:hypothetical protein DMN91_012333 [Ooceraea biroi]|uniref:Protein phosphatase 1 regulatory subunit 35 C-terminal domain-containing protein n=1 Tax=Ooceraea biroi TaxID=2015173 RepID=A0A026VV00_OOCBI|nr:uncharacterized protein LOC105286209 [Ooceraea biroi]EZA47598.1 hypothetical protein X777_15346 [Ooceraea biroi]RLU15339.1 hypothetical protein DMN91_012333 [Ooceraea biroi]
MSGKPDSKKISRPKVSFRQSEQDEEETVKQSKEKATQQSEGPKIRSVVTLHAPVRIVNPEKATGAGDKGACSSERKADSSTHTGDTASENAPDTSQAVKDAARTGEMCHASDVKEKHDVSQLSKTLDNIVKNYTNLQQKGKEKMKDTSKGAAKLQPVPIPRVAKLGKPPATRAEAPKAKSATPSLQSSHMPYYKMLVKNKPFSVKTNVKNPHVKDEPELLEEFLHLILPWHKNYRTEEFESGRHYVGQSLEHPKCNSIVCIADKLKKLEQQKISADINHLSPLEKTILNGKISTALDFKLDEAIYKDLVNLSLDEEMFPRAVTRTKDPEPRQKDIMPKLSDFFIPEAMKEQCEAVHVKPRPPKIDENWNAFRISAKILEWRYNLDDLDEVA